MQKLSLDALARELGMAREKLLAARQASSGRSAPTVFGGHEHVLRQTVIALLAGRALGDHENPGEATIHVLRGRVRLHSGNDAWDGRQGDLLVVPAAVHGLEATEDAVVLLTVAKTPVNCAFLRVSEFIAPRYSARADMGVLRPRATASLHSPSSRGPVIRSMA